MRKVIVLIAGIVIIVILLFVLFAGRPEVFKYVGNPFSSDTDSDGLPNEWESEHGFNPTDPQDALKDPDHDGLNNVQEYRLGTVIKNGVLSFDKDLFVEIDYMSGYRPSTDATNWFVTYYQELGIKVNINVDDEITTSQLAAEGVSSSSISLSDQVLIEREFHDNPSTHIYVFYAKSFSDSEALGQASECGAFINKEKVNSQEGLSVLWLTDRTRAEKVILLHEIGHTLNVITWSNGKEDYCNSLGCIMAGVDRWWDLLGGIAQAVVLYSNTPRYCQTHVKQIDLTNKWSVN
jgi:hypothetical protein